MKTLKDFADRYGIRAIVRRHFEYDNPATQLKSDRGSALVAALTYSRCLDPGKLGLSANGARDALKQGHLLAEMGIRPKSIICGLDQRNYDGARLTAAGLREATGVEVPYYTSPAVTYPHYSNVVQASDAFTSYGDYVVHMYLAGRGEMWGLWTETRHVFKTRIVSAIEANYPSGGPVLFDLNFEQLTLLHYLDVMSIKEMDNIPWKSDEWVPTKGGGIVYGNTAGIVAEFKPDLTLI